MIRSFRHKGLKEFFSSGKTKGIRADQVQRIRIILARLAASLRASDMALPGLRLHPLKGQLKEYFAVDVSGNWRIVFRLRARMLSTLIS
jgi:proteic killer suppression protein